MNHIWRGDEQELHIATQTVDLLGLPTLVGPYTALSVFGSNFESHEGASDAYALRSRVEQLQVIKLDGLIARNYEGSFG